MRISDAIARIEEYAPVSLAEDYDNVGLLIGDGAAELKSALLTLDVDINVACEAAECGANLIISHHPLIFSPINRITADTAEGRCLIYLIKNDIAVYSAHTNLDSTEGGLSDILAALLRLEDVRPMCGAGENTGIGRVGVLPAPLSMDELSKNIMKLFGLAGIRYTGNGSDIVSRVAVCSGGGGSMIADAAASLADVYITGDIKYHNAREAEELGINLIELSHYDSENTAAELFAKILGSDIKTYIAKSNKNVFNTLINDF